MKKKKTLNEENWDALLEKSLSKVKGGVVRRRRAFKTFNR